MQPINQLLATHYGKIKFLLLVPIIGAVLASGYLFLTRPQHKITPETAAPPLSKANPIITKLPYRDPYFIVSYKTIDSGSDIIVTVHTSSPRYRYYAMKQIYALGFDPTDYVVEYNDFKNPLGN